MEEIQRVFLWWIVKFVALCAVTLFTLRWVDRRWRKPETAPAASAALAMSRRRHRG